MKCLSNRPVEITEGGFSNMLQSRLLKVGAIIAVVAAIALVVAACAGNQSAPPKAYITLVSEGHEGGSLGPDGLKHDTIIPADFTVYAGQTVELSAVNYDEGAHTITNPALGIDFQFPGAKSDGVPSVTQFQFTPTKAGVYQWYCRLPCDLGQGGWAMTNGGQPGFMAGNITVLGK